MGTTNTPSHEDNTPQELREPAPSSAKGDPDTAKIIDALNTCIETCIDGEKGYAIASANVRDSMLKALFFHYEAQRASFVQALQQAIEGLAGYAENQGTLRGVLHRGFAGARVAIEGHTDAVILGECERGELAALAKYDRVLDDLGTVSLPIPIRALLVDQRASIKLAHDDLTRKDLARRARIAAGSD